MNLKYFVIILLVFVWLPVEAQYDFDAAERERMVQAGVKTKTQWTYEYVNGKPSNKGYKSQVTNYNVKGNVTEIVNYNEAGKIILVDVYQYDNRDNRISYERYQGNREKLQNSQKIQYDANSNKIREYGYDGAATYNNTFYYSSDGKLSEIVYTVDNAVIERRRLSYYGNKTDIQIFDSRNKLMHRQENTYDNNGLLLTEVKIGGQGNVIQTLDLLYNTAGDLMEEIRKRANDMLDYQKTYQYDKENRPIREETVNLDGIKFVSREYQYNHLGNLTMETWKKTDRTMEYSSRKITCDSKGLNTEEECYFATYKLYSLYKYEYVYY